MPDLMLSLQSLAKEKIAVMRRQSELLEILKRVLPSIGYKLVRTQDSPTAGSASRASALEKSLACPHCDRRFAKPLHLGRHVAATHKIGRRQRTRGTKTTTGRVSNGARSARKRAA